MRPRDPNPAPLVGGNPVNAVDVEGLDYTKNGIIYSDCGELIGEVGLEPPDPFLDPIDYISLILGGNIAFKNTKLFSGNPFQGKSAKEIDKMFRAKGFEPRGPNPIKGEGGYVNPKTSRSYHIDEANRFGEPPHVDVNRPRGYYGLLKKRKFDMEKK